MARRFSWGWLDGWRLLCRRRERSVCSRQKAARRPTGSPSCPGSSGGAAGGGPIRARAGSRQAVTANASARTYTDGSYEIYLPVPVPA